MNGQPEIVLRFNTDLQETDCCCCGEIFKPDVLGFVLDDPPDCWPVCEWCALSYGFTISRPDFCHLKWCYLNEPELSTVTQ